MLTIYLNYSDASHVITGVDLKERLIEFRTKILKGVIHATWHPNLVKIPEKKGWLVKKENLELLYTNLKEHNISYTVLDTPLPSGKDEWSSKPVPPNPQAWHDCIENIKAESEQNWSTSITWTGMDGYKTFLISGVTTDETSTERIFGARPVPDFEGLYALHHPQLAKDQSTDTSELGAAQQVNLQTDATAEWEAYKKQPVENVQVADVEVVTPH